MKAEPKDHFPKWMVFNVPTEMLLSWAPVSNIAHMLRIEHGQLNSKEWCKHQRRVFSPGYGWWLNSGTRWAVQRDKRVDMKETRKCHEMPKLFQKTSGFEAPPCPFRPWPLLRGLARATSSFWGGSRDFLGEWAIRYGKTFQTNSIRKIRRQSIFDSSWSFWINAATLWAAWVISSFRSWTDLLAQWNQFASDEQPHLKG